VFKRLTNSYTILPMTERFFEDIINKRRKFYYKKFRNDVFNN